MNLKLFMRNGIQWYQFLSLQRIVRYKSNKVSPSWIILAFIRPARLFRLATDLIYGYTRQKVNNTNAFHNNRQNVIRKKKIKAAFINILRFECVKMNFKFSTAKKVKVSQFLSL